jgi:hypothetical protein
VTRGKKPRKREKKMEKNKEEEKKRREREKSLIDSPSEIHDSSIPFATNPRTARAQSQ